MTKLQSIIGTYLLPKKLFLLVWTDKLIIDVFVSLALSITDQLIRNKCYVFGVVRLKTWSELNAIM